MRRNSCPGPSTKGKVSQECRKGEAVALSLCPRASLMLFQYWIHDLSLLVWLIHHVSAPWWPSRSYLFFVYSLRKLLWSIYSIPGMIQDIMLWEQCKKQDRQSLPSGGLQSLWCAHQWQLWSVSLGLDFQGRGSDWFSLFAVTGLTSHRCWLNDLITTLAENLYPRDWG